MSEKVEKGRLKKYGKEYGKYAACVVTGFALYGAEEVNRKLGDPARNAILERKRYGEGDRQYDLLVDGLGGKGGGNLSHDPGAEKCRQMKCRKSFRRSWNA